MGLRGASALLPACHGAASSVCRPPLASYPVVPRIPYFPSGGRLSQGSATLPCKIARASYSLLTRRPCHAGVQPSLGKLQRRHDRQDLVFIIINNVTRTGQCPRLANAGAQLRRCACALCPAINGDSCFSRAFHAAVSPVLGRTTRWQHRTSSHMCLLTRGRRCWSRSMAWRARASEMHQLPL